MTTTLAAPAFCWVPESTSTAGGEAADLAESVGWVPFPEQRLALDALLAENRGKWAAFESAIVCGRQNLKTWVLEVAALHDLFLRGVSRVVWSAHQYRTTADSYQHLAAVVENYDHLRKRVHKVYAGAGEQRIELLPRHTGPRIDFLARSSGGGRGLAGDVVVLDEALYLTPTMMGALLPTLSSKDDPQVRYGSSPGLLTSDVLRAVRDRGRAGGDPSLIYVEWTSPAGDCASPSCRHELGAPGCLLDDEDRWAQANPALGRRISLDYVRNERRALSADPVEFMRERLGWWQDPPPDGAGNPIPMAAWSLCESPAGPDGTLTFGVDVAVDGSWSVIAAAGSGPDDATVVEVVENRPGTGWVVDRLVELWDRWSPHTIVVDPAGPAGALLADMEARDLPVTQMAARDLAQACGELKSAVVDRELLHRGQPMLDAAMRYAVAKPRADAWAWSRQHSTGDISPLIAVTAAFWGRDRGGDPQVFVL